MKKLNKAILMSLMFVASLMMASCGGIGGQPAEAKTVTKEVSQPASTVTGSTDGWTFIKYELDDFADQDVTISFSADMKVTNNGSKTERLMWQVNTSDYPVIAEHDFPVGTSDFVTVTGSNEEPLSLGTNVLYLSTYETEKDKLTIEVKNVKYTVSYKTAATSTKVSFLDEEAPSIYETYKDKFESFGFAVPNNQNGLQNSKTIQGIKKHGTSITAENEFKPDAVFGWGGLNGSTKTVKFQASNGLEIDVPASLNGLTTVDTFLKTAKENGLKIRGHVLVWHSQTPDNFFAKGYSAVTSGELITNLVDKETMSARQEWYIKTVLEHVAEWEKENNNGEHIVWAWDVVNEALEGSTAQWLRGQTSGTADKSPSNGGSRWYQIYKSEEFIVDAFRYATAYAPSDVALCYNDYNEWYTSWGNQKPENICNLIDCINKAEAKTINGASVKPRIDAVGMQSHVGLDNPGVSNYEKAIQKYLDKGVDIHVTEFDISASTSKDSASGYKNYFTLFQKYGTGNDYSDHKIVNVTVWGVNNKNSWIYSNAKYPLLFDNFNCTDSYWAVINAAK